MKVTLEVPELVPGKTFVIYWDFDLSKAPSIATPEAIDEFQRFLRDKMEEFMLGKAGKLKTNYPTHGTVLEMIRWELES